MKSRGGFSLLETTLYAALLSLALGMAMDLFHRGFRSHRRVEACISDVETALRLDRQLRADLGASKTAAIGEDGSLSLDSGALAYVPVGDGVERRDARGVVRGYSGVSGWALSREGRLVRARWKAPPRGRNGEGGAPPAFETAAMIGGKP